jgi:thioredoxin 1
MSKPYEPEPSRETVENLQGAAVLDFGENWCGYCKAAEPIIEAALDGYADLPHIKVRDGKGQPLGRAFGVKLWPTLIFLRDGKEVARVVRPSNVAEIRDELQKISS